MINILHSDGTLNAQAGPYEGLTIREARKRVVADLESDQLLESVEDRKIDLAHSDRSKTPIEPYLADQWFISMDVLAQSSMDAVRDGRVKIIPQRYEKGYLDWLSEKRDWPVSRQLWWGHRIPVWSYTPKDTQQFTTTKATLEADSAAKEDKFYILVAEDENCGGTLPEESAKQPTLHVCLREDDPEIIARLEALGFLQDPDVLDTWFSSALWPHSTLGWPEETAELEYFYPTNVLVTSRDIITLWVARMILASLFNTGKHTISGSLYSPKNFGRLWRDYVQIKGQRSRSTRCDQSIWRRCLAVWNCTSCYRKPGCSDESGIYLPTLQRAWWSRQKRTETLPVVELPQV